MPEDQIPDDDDELIFTPEDVANNNDEDDVLEGENLEAERANEDPFALGFDGHLNGGRSPDAPSDAARRLLGAIDHTSDMDEEPFGTLEGFREPERRAITYNFFDCDKPSDHLVFEALEHWVRWLVWHFELGDVVPVCWAEHDAIAEEMAALYEGWTGIYEARSAGHPLDQLTWLGHLDSSLSRVATKWDRANCGSRGQHDAENSLRSVWPDMAEHGGPYHEDSNEALTSIGAGTDEERS
ncbi:MAG: hypothetical protein ABSC00_06960 [Acidimicrobiales bacterium]|jgi:hypothetical protein